MLPLPYAPKQGKSFSPCYPSDPQTILPAPGQAPHCLSSFLPHWSIYKPATHDSGDGKDLLNFRLCVPLLISICSGHPPLLLSTSGLGEYIFFSCNHLYALSLFLSLTPLSVIRAPAAPTVTFSLKSIFCSPTSHDVTVFLPLVVWFCLIDFLGVQNYLVFIKLCSRNVASLGSYSSAILSLLMSTKHFLNLSRNHSVS